MSLRRLMPLLVCVVGYVGPVPALAGAAEAPVPERIDFNRDVRPILSEN
jgi:hypothetical protein